tara:strand:+ start:1214 stop:1432 length:219 start_codon:yes stop_codon:yes gene_type:complete
MDGMGAESDLKQHRHLEVIADGEILGAVCDRCVFSERVEALLAVGIDAVVMALKHPTAGVKEQLVQVGGNQA